MLTTSLAFTAIRIALAIVFDTIALVVWDIGTRSPVRLFTDLRAGMGNPTAIVRGATRFAIGIVALVAAVTVSAPVASHALDATIVECWALATALVLEQLLGPDLRARRR